MFLQQGITLIKFACLNQCYSIYIKQKLAEESFSSGIKFDLLPEFLFDIDEDSLQLEQNTKSLGTPIWPGLSVMIFISVNDKI